MISFHAKSQAFGLLGIAIINVWLAKPASARDWSVAEPICSNEYCLKISPKPSIFLSNNTSIASGVTSSWVSPVPPEIKITWISGLSSQLLTNERIWY